MIRAFTAVFAFLLCSYASAGAEERVRLSTGIDAYLFRPEKTEAAPAVVLMHGCGGLLRNGRIVSRETDWTTRLIAAGYVVLLPDSFTTRGIKEMCAPAHFHADVYSARTNDALAALHFLQLQPYIDGARVALIGWSEGGGVVLRTVRAVLGFRAAVAFYPASCSERALGERWRSLVPLLVLIGGRDVWTPATPCRELLQHDAARNTLVQVQIYPQAYHDFDWPGLALHRLPTYQTTAGVVPITGMDSAARADALERVPAFLARELSDTTSGR